MTNSQRQRQNIDTTDKSTYKETAHKCLFSAERNCDVEFLDSEGDFLANFHIYIGKMLSIFLKVPHNISFGTIFTQLHGFTTLAYSTLTQAHANTMLSFDTDLSFWVCGNSATGHICNDKALFHGKLVPSVYIVGAATGLSEPSLMGTVLLKVTDDNGKKHTFMLTHVNYMPNFPVNLLST